VDAIHRLASGKKDLVRADELGETTAGGVLHSDTPPCSHS
jgi:hypothetical protein